MTDLTEAELEELEVTGWVDIPIWGRKKLFAAARKGIEAEHEIGPSSLKAWGKMHRKMDKLIGILGRVGDRLALQELHASPIQREEAMTTKCFTPEPVAPPTRTHRGSITASCGHKLTDAEIEYGCGYPVRYKSGDTGVTYATYCAKCRDELMQTDDYLASDEAADDYINSLNVPSPSPAIGDVEKLIERLYAAVHLESAAISPRTSPLIEAAKEAAAMLRSMADEIDGLKAAQEIQADNMKTEIELLAVDKAKVEEELVIQRDGWRDAALSCNQHLAEIASLRAKLERATPSPAVGNVEKLSSTLERMADAAKHLVIGPSDTDYANRLRQAAAILRSLAAEKAKVEEQRDGWITQWEDDAIKAETIIASLRAKLERARDLLAIPKWKSCEKDNMEFSAKITCFTHDKIIALLEELK